MPVLPAENEIMEHARRVLAARVARDGIRAVTTIHPGATAKDEERRQRSYRSCHLPAEEKTRHAPPRDSGAYVPEMAARIEYDRNLTDGARHCARILTEYTYRGNREARAADITVTYLMRALGKCRRTVQGYLRQLERAGYIDVQVVHARTRMCVGLFIELLAPLFPRHQRQKWPAKLMDSDVQKDSHNNRSRYKTVLISRREWAARCAEGVWRAWERVRPPLPAFPVTVCSRF